jgi:hypothetical protein
MPSELVERPGIWNDSVVMVLLTVFAVALSQQPKVRRTLQKEIADYQANAEARAFAAEQAAATKAGDDRDEVANVTRSAR